MYSCFYPLKSFTNELHEIVVVVVTHQRFAVVAVAVKIYAVR